MAGRVGSAGSRRRSSRFERELADQIGQICFAQFLLFRQGERLKAYANAKGISLIGDLPFFVSPDSSDVWAHPELFLLDERPDRASSPGCLPTTSARQGNSGVIPFITGTLCGEPDYRWSVSRLRALLTHVDVIRLDHFRAFAAAWHVPAGAPTAQSGKWVAGPGADFFHAVQQEFGTLPFIAEDLGMITPDVYALRDQFHLPGMRVLQFAFDGKSDNPNLPEQLRSQHGGLHRHP